MGANLQDILLASLRHDVKKHQRHAQRTATLPGFVLKVNGMQLFSSVATKFRKRPHDRTDTSPPRRTGSTESQDEAWPSLVLATLSSVLQQLESDQQKQRDETANQSAAPSTVSALRSVTGLELRHCRLRANNLCTKDHSTTGGVSLSDIVLSPQRLWNSTTHAVPPATCVSLTTLDLECNELGDAGLQLLCCSLLVHLRSLRRLLLASNNITSAGLLLLAGAAQPQGGGDLPPNLETIGLTNNPLGAQARETVRGRPSEEDWSRAFRTLASHLSSTLRRVHLNHAGLSTQEVFCVLHTLLECVVARSKPCVFDMVYLRENQLADKAEVLSLLRGTVEDPTELNIFLERHVSM
ncbi:hypothetical protein LSCM4_04152 [Leishmania orientalis]|uniref:Leucine-rich repeat protein n=1 Tax=Leishmania orientalis TaxID=2249476 RepID=A0A836HEV5_9TRYP|nr:hypothetical protein LSCM4_04152 [Leishmania orientalis]